MQFQIYKTLINNLMKFLDKLKCVKKSSRYLPINPQYIPKYLKYLYILESYVNCVNEIIPKKCLFPIFQEKNKHRCKTV